MFWCVSEYDDSDAEIKTRRFTYMPEEAGQPLKVRAVCLPFVLVKTMNGERGTLDLRRHRVAKLTREYGGEAFKAKKKGKKKHRKK
jgi:hypothetical protein